MRTARQAFLNLREHSFTFGIQLIYGFGKEQIRRLDAHRLHSEDEVLLMLQKADFVLPFFKAAEVSQLFQMFLIPSG